MRAGAVRRSDQVVERDREGEAANGDRNRGLLTDVSFGHEDTTGLAVHADPARLVLGEHRRARARIGRELELADLGLSVGSLDKDVDRGGLDEPVVQGVVVERAREAAVANIVGDGSVASEDDAVGEVLGAEVASVEGPAPRRSLRLLSVGVDSEAGEVRLLPMVVEGRGDLRLRIAAGVGRIGARHEFGVVGPTVVVLVALRIVAIGIEAVPKLPGGRDAVAVVVELAVRETGDGIDRVVVVGVARDRVGRRAREDLHPVLETVVVPVAGRSVVGITAAGRFGVGPGGGAADPREADEVRPLGLLDPGVRSGRLAVQGFRLVGRRSARRVPRDARIVPERVRERNLDGGGVPADKRRGRESESGGLALVVGLVAVEVHPAEEPVRPFDHVRVGPFATADHVLERHREGVGPDRVPDGGGHPRVGAARENATRLELDADHAQLVLGE